MEDLVTERRLDEGAMVCTVLAAVWWMGLAPADPIRVDLAFALGWLACFAVLGGGLAQVLGGRATARILLMGGIASGTVAGIAGLGATLEVLTPPVLGLLTTVLVLPAAAGSAVALFDRARGLASVSALASVVVVVHGLSASAEGWTHEVSLMLAVGVVSGGALVANIPALRRAHLDAHLAPWALLALWSITEAMLPVSAPVALAVQGVLATVWLVGVSLMARSARLGSVTLGASAWAAVQVALCSPLLLLAGVILQLTAAMVVGTTGLAALVIVHAAKRASLDPEGTVTTVRFMWQPVSEDAPTVCHQARASC